MRYLPCNAAPQYHIGTIVAGGDFGDFGVSFVSTVAGRYTRRGGPLVTLVTLVSHCGPRLW